MIIIKIEMIIEMKEMANRLCQPIFIAWSIRYLGYTDLRNTEKAITIKALMNTISPGSSMSEGMLNPNHTGERFDGQKIGFHPPRNSRVNMRLKV